MAHSLKNAKISNTVLKSTQESVRASDQQDRSGQSLKSVSEITESGSQDGRSGWGSIWEISNREAKDIGGSHVLRAEHGVTLATEWVSWVGTKQETHRIIVWRPRKDYHPPKRKSLALSWADPEHQPQN